MITEGRPRDYVAYYARVRGSKLSCADLEGGRALTYAALDARANSVAAVISERLGGGCEGARVAVVARNSSDLVCIYIACLRLRAVFSPLNWRLSAVELAALAREVDPALVIYDGEFEALAHSVASAAPTASSLRFGAELDAEIAAMSAAPPAYPPRQFSDLTTLLCTSGTTGKPKAVMVSELNAEASANNYAFSAEFGPHSVFLCDMPMFHVVGLLAMVRTATQFGATLLISQKFDPEETITRIADPSLGVTHYFCAPQMGQMMRRARNFDPAVFRRLTALQTGGAPHPAQLVREWHDDGVRLVDGFGMSEAGTVFGMPPGDLDLLRRKAGSAGLPALNVEARLVDREGRDVQVGEVGEIWLRGSSVTKGYWRNEQATQAAFQHGWFKSGDAAQCDSEGFYTLVDRWKDMYVTGGENVYPAEVEGALIGFAGVAEIAVVGVPDPRWGETGAAFVVAARDASPQAEEIVAFCRQRLAAYKAPKHVVFVEALPRTASGKLQKDVLRKQWTERPGE